ncbi:MAG: PEP-CTERM sorting domain-containing protein [Phycisphaerae bacterium]
MRRVVCAVVIGMLSAAGAAQATPYELPDAELNTAEFGQLAGYSASTSTLDGKNDVAGPGVQFALTLSGSDDGKMGTGDLWPTNSAAGFGWDSVLGHWTSLAAYDSYRMNVKYVSGPADSTVNVSLFLNTGLTGLSGDPSNDSTNDTFWAGPWTEFSLGQTATLVLDFSGAEAWHIEDNKEPHTGWDDPTVSDGDSYAINERDRNEITNIGLQVADFDGNVLGEGQVVLHLNVPEPATLGLMVAGGAGLLVRRRRR